MLGERLPRICRNDTPSGADKEVRPERGLELANLLGDGGLRDPQVIGRGGEGSEFRCRAEAPELLKRQKLRF